ncbi:MAG: Gfo/Idh/MocA family oxidoreductase [Lachnospiraceae bacterium]|nr:Gfo/Idh/MocA family oxidoreductase [Lachnospiraceae bacterium]
MERKTMKAAVIGCGMISEVYIPSIQKNFSILDVVACSDLARDRMEQTAAQYGIKAMTQEEILADPEIEMVINLTNPVAHYPVTKAALEAGKHVWSEKMIAVDLEQGRELVEIAKKNGVRLGVAPDTFLGASVQTSRYIIDKGLIGKPLSFVAHISRDYAVYGEILPHLRRKGGGILFDMGGYYLTALASLFGPVREVSAFTAINDPVRKGSRVDMGCKYYDEPYEIEVSNLIAASLKYDCGVIGTLHMNSDCLYRPTTALVVYGTEGILTMGDPNEFGEPVKLTKLKDAEFEYPLTHDFKTNCRGLGAAEMAWAIRTGRPHRASMEMAFNVFETAHMIERSSAEGKVETLTSTFEKPAPLAAGFIGNGYWGPTAESALVK